MQHRLPGWEETAIGLVGMALAGGLFSIASLLTDANGFGLRNGLVAAQAVSIAASAVALLLLSRHLLRSRRAADAPARLQAAVPAAFDDIAEIASTWIWESDDQHRLRFFAGRQAELPDADATQVIGRTRLDLGLRTDDPEDARRHSADLAARRPFRDFVYYVERQGHRHYRRIGGKPLFSSDGDFLGYRGTAADITAEIAARDSAEQAGARLRDAIESIPEGFVLYDADDRLVMCNSRARTIMSLPGLLKPGLSFGDYARACAESGELTGAIGRTDDWLADRMRRHYRAEGVSEQWSAHGRCLRISERRTREGGVVCLYADITQAKRREQELAEHGRLLRTVLEHMNHGISVVDAELRLVAWNAKFNELLRFPAGLFEEGPTTLASLFRYNAMRGEYGPGDVEELVRERVELALRFEPHYFERTRPDGTVLEIRGNPLPDGGFVTVYTDVTARKHAEARLRESQDRYRQLVELSPDAILVHRDDSIQFANTAAARLIGVSAPERLIGTSFSDCLHPDCREAARAGVAEILSTGKRLPVAQMTLLRRDGTDLPVEVEGTVFPGQGEPSVLSVMRDVAERRQAEAELLAAKEQAEFASQAKTDFLANMSHELRTPLNAVIGFSEIIGTELFGPVGSRRYIEYAEDIQASGRHLLDLINDILDLSKAESGKLELREEPVNVTIAVESSIRLLRERASRGGVRLVNAVNGVPKLRGDERMLKQMLLNLLSNAIKFTPKGGSVAVDAAQDEAGALLIRVTDTGIGIAEKDIPQVLEAFTQVESSLTRKYQGTGLGLPLTKTLAELHGGALTIDSAVGRGTTVTVRMPKERLLG